MRALNDLYLLMDTNSTNGTRFLVVACAPGDNPYKHAREWFRRQGFRHWETASEDLEIIRRMEEATTQEGCLFGAEWYDGVVAGGHPKRKPTRYDLGFKKEHT